MTPPTSRTAHHMSMSKQAPPRMSLFSPWPGTNERGSKTFILCRGTWTSSLLRPRRTGWQLSLEEKPQGDCTELPMHKTNPVSLEQVRCTGTGKGLILPQERINTHTHTPSSLNPEQSGRSSQVCNNPAPLMEEEEITTESDLLGKKWASKLQGSVRLVPPFDARNTLDDGSRFSLHICYFPS